MERKRNNTLDLIKVVAALFVLLIHFPFPGEFGSILKAEGRFAVPFFFMVSGYFCVSKTSECSAGLIRRKVKHILLIYLVGAAIYILYNFASEGSGFFTKYFTGFSNIRYSLFRYFVFNDPILSHSHLWFLLALIYTYVFFFIFMNIKALSQMGGVESSDTYRAAHA